MNTLRHLLKTSLLFLGIVLLHACGGGGGGSGDPAKTLVARVAITPGSALLTSVGGTQPLTAQAFDASGNAVAATFTWTSSKPDIVTVTSDGKITAAALGSAQIVAQAGGVSSASALIAVAMPAAGVVVIEDSQVVSAPSVADTTTEFDVGMQYQVTLSGIAVPAVGTLISSSGVQPVAGRVVAAQESGGSVILTLEVVPVADLFPDLAIDETIDLSNAKVVVPPEVTEFFTVTQRPDGSMEYKPKNGDSVTFSGGGDVAPRARQGSATPRSAAAKVVDPLKKEFKVGLFECEASLGFPLVNITVGSLNKDSNLRFVVRHDPVADALTRLTLVGDLKVEGKAQVVIASAAEGAVECKMKLGEFPVPLPGPFAALFGHVPFGLGLGAGGKLTVANLGYEAFASASGTMEVGLSCPDPNQDCEFLHVLSGKTEGKTQPILPPEAANLDAALRIEPEMSVFGTAAFAIRPFSIEKFKVEIFAAKFGPKLAANLSTVVGQLADGNYKSDYKLTIETVAGTGKEIKSIFNFFKLTIAKAEFKNNILLSQSPAATTFTNQRTGDAVTFTVDLDPQTLTWPMFSGGNPPTTVVGIPIPEFLYNVQEIKIFQKKVVNGVIDPVLIASQIAADGQTNFVVNGTAMDSNNDFFAFVETRFLPLPGVRDLELGGGVKQSKIAFTSNRDGNYEIYVMNADGSGQTNLTNNTAGDVYPSWSPDGTRIAFISTRDVGDNIYVMNADGSGQTQLTNNASIFPAWFPAWSPDSTRIAFVSQRDGNTEIYIMNADGSGQTNLTNNAAYDENPSWSPDGTRIAFTSARDGNKEIYVMNADGSGQARLTNNATIDASPSWSPDSTRIAFASTRDSNSEIYVMNTDGSGQTRLTNNAAFDHVPSWSPDGTRITFVSDRDGNREIYVMNADGGGQIRLTNNAADDNLPSWSPK